MLAPQRPRSRRLVYARLGYGTNQLMVHLIPYSRRGSLSQLDTLRLHRGRYYADPGRPTKPAWRSPFGHPALT
jgi:hypothetical protein